MQGRALATVLIALIALVALASADAGAAATKRGKINVCVTKTGHDKGAMRFAGKKKCHKGEKRITWNKKGVAGPAGQRGPEGPAGQSSSVDLDALRAQIEAQAAQIAALQSQLSAACAQLSTVTTQLNALGVALDGIGLGGTIPPLLNLINPGAPSPLPAFSC